MISKPVIMRGGEYKCRIFEMHLKLRDQQLKTIMHMYRLLYQNLMVQTNQKSIIDITQIRKKNPNTTLKEVIKSKEKRKKEERKKKRLTKINPKQLIKFQ